MALCAHWSFNREWLHLKNSTTLIEYMKSKVCKINMIKCYDGPKYECLDTEMIHHFSSCLSGW